MSGVDLEKLKGLQFDVSKVNFEPPRYTIAQSAIDDMNKRTQQITVDLTRAREERDAEELRRHNELISALKEAGEKGATIVIGDNATGIQIQQNSTGTWQNMTNTIGLDYAQTLKVLEVIKGYFDFPKFQETFGENTDNVKAVVEETIKAAQDKEDENLIKKSLRVIKELATGAAGSLIASGILSLLGTLNIG